MVIMPCDNDICSHRATFEVGPLTDDKANLLSCTNHLSWAVRKALEISEAVIVHEAEEVH